MAGKMSRKEMKAMLMQRLHSTPKKESDEVEENRGHRGRAHVSRHKKMSMREMLRSGKLDRPAASTSGRRCWHVSGYTRVFRGKKINVGGHQRCRK
jgi:hypothetical protein